MIYGDNSNIMVAAMWRCGSTHIARGLGRMLGWRSASTCGYHGEGMEQQDINPFTAAILFPYGYQVFHQHVWASRRNIELLRDFNVKTVVCYRSIPDTLVSIRERVMSMPSFVIPGLPLQKEWWSMTEEQQYIWLAHHAAPWQAQFYATWKTANLDTYHIRYNDFYEDQVSGFRNLLLWLEIPTDKLDCPIEDVVKTKHNLSVGVSGRGSKIMPTAALDLVGDVVRSWQWPDMERDLL